MPASALDTQGAPDSGATAWLLTSTALVLLMTLPGLALLYGGLVRSRNVLSVLVRLRRPGGRSRERPRRGRRLLFRDAKLKRRLRIDDSLDAFPVHGVGGFSGLRLTAVFSAPALGGLGLPAV